MSKHLLFASLLVCLSLPCRADLVLGIDGDTTLPGVQTSIDVAPGEIFTIDVFVENICPADIDFDLVTAEILFGGPVVPIGPPISAVSGEDIFAPGLVSPGDPLTTDPLLPPAGSHGSIGLIFMPETTIPAGTATLLFSVDFVADGPGVADIALDPFFALDMAPLTALSDPLEIEIIAVPEPGSMGLIGLVSCLIFGRRRSRR